MVCSLPTILHGSNGAWVHFTGTGTRTETEIERSRGTGGMIETGGLAAIAILSEMAARVERVSAFFLHGSHLLLSTVQLDAGWQPCDLW